LRDATTLATRVGAAPEWIAAAALVVLLGVSAVRRRRAAPESQQPENQQPEDETPESKDEDDDDRP
jgi:apolipoprotein N-acyltransferase